MKSFKASNSLYTLVANLSQAICNWLLLVLVTKFFVSEELGFVVLSLSVLSPLFLFASLKLRTLIIVDTENEFPIAQYFTTRFLFNLAVLLLLPLIWWVFFAETLSPLVLIIIAIYKWCDAWCELGYSYQHRHGQFRRVAITQSIRSFLGISVFFLLAWSDASLTVALAGWCVVTLIFAIIESRFVATHVKRFMQQPFGFKAVLQTREYYKGAMTLFKRYYTLCIALMMASLFVYIPNFALQYFQSVEAAGEFAVISYFLVAGSILITSVSQVASPHFVSLIKNEAYTDYKRMAFKLCFFGLLLGLAGLGLAWLIGEWLLRVVYTPAFAEYHAELVWVMGAAAIRYAYVFLGTAMNALKQFAEQTQIYMVGTGCVLVFCLVLVPQYGALGAAIAMFIATCVELVLFLLRFSHSSRTLSRSQLSVG